MTVPVWAGGETRHSVLADAVEQPETNNRREHSKREGKRAASGGGWRGGWQASGA